MGREQEYVEKGLAILTKEGVEISAEGHGSVLPWSLNSSKVPSERAFEPASSSSLLRKFKIGTTVLPIGK